MPLKRPHNYKWKFFEEVGYHPRSGQLRLHAAADRFRYIGYYAYPRGGKSYGAAMEVAATVNEPDYHIWLVAPTYELGSKEFGYIYQAHLQAGYLSKAKQASFNLSGGDMRIEYPWGWWVEVKSAERPQLLLAEELDDMILCEAARLPESIWFRSLFNRAEKRKGRVFVPTTPAGQNWIHKEFWTRSLKLDSFGQRNEIYDPVYWAVRISHLEEEKGVPNVHYQPGVYDKDTIDRARRQMEPQLFREQFGGDFVSYAGTVYPGDKIKRIKPFVIPDDWPVVIGYDHGASGRKGGNTAITFVAWDNESPRNCYLFDLIYTAGHGAKWYAEQIKNTLRKTDGTQRPVEIVVVDRSAKQVRIELTLEGIPNTTPAFSDFKAKYTRMMSLIEEGRFYVVEKKSLDKFWYEIGRYEWKEGVKGEPRGDQVQGPDDSLDSCGYALLHPVRDVTDEEKESSAHIRTERAEAMRTPLSDNEKKYWGILAERHRERDAERPVEYEENEREVEFVTGLFEE
jgi:hypothetical protein